jgi:hypothetical protein
MTLIGFATYGSTAEFITDTLAYLPGAQELGKTTKSTLLNHIDTAIITQGSDRFGHVATAWLSQLSGRIPNFDGLTEAASDTLRDIWNNEPACEGQDPETYWGASGATIFLIGYSPSAGEFRAFSFAFDRGLFDAEPIDRPHVMPAPFTVAPSAMEVDRLVAALEDEVDDAYLHALSHAWPSKPALEAPRTRLQWVQLAKASREQRALDQGRTRTLVGGDVHHTRLGRGKASTHIIHSFNDRGEEFQKLISWTFHPQAQLVACWCSSGKTWRECHMLEAIDGPCGCGSGQTLGDCHAVVVSNADSLASA